MRLVVIGAFVGTTARLYMFWGGSSAPARFLVPILPCLAPLLALAVAEARSPAARALLGGWMTIGLIFAAVGVGWPGRLLLFSEPHGRARVLEAIQGGSPLALVVPTLTDPDWASQLGQLGAWLAAALVALIAVAAASRLGQQRAWRLAGVGSLTFLVAGAMVSARPSPTVREATSIRGDIDALWRYDGTRLRTLDYSTLGRATPERLRQLSTIVVTAQPADVSASGYVAGPFALPPGSYEATIWFSSARARAREVVVGAPPQAVFGRVSGTLTSPASVQFSLPVPVRRLTLRVPEARNAGDVTRIEIAPREVVPPGGRPTIPVRAVESVPGREGSYLVYTDEEAYPEGGIFWSRETAETRVVVVPGGATRMILTLSTGPMSGEVHVSVDGNARTVAMTAGRTEQMAFDLHPGASLVPMTVRSTVMFRPAEVDNTSTDTRGLGCQVRVEFE